MNPSAAPKTRSQRLQDLAAAAGQLAP